MKILQVNKFLYQQGGAETYLFDLTKVLRQNGHEVVYFSQKNLKNIENTNNDLFLSPINLQKFSFSSLVQIGRIFWSFEASKKIIKILQKENPDLVHIHNIYHQISPSILSAIRKQGIPIVMTVHDWKLIRHDYIYRADNKVVKNKNSSLVDALLKLEYNFHKLINVYKKNIDLFIAPSKLVKDELVKNGFEANKIIVQPYCIDIDGYKPNNLAPENYILFFGRLHESKGADTLINAFAKIRNKTIKLKIAGSGPQEKELKELAKNLNLSDRVEFLGQKQKNELIGLIQASMFTVMPSRFHETLGLSALETFACGRTVIASKAGALTEFINANNGLLVEVDDVFGFSQAISSLIDGPEIITKLGINARITSEAYDPKSHYDKIIKIYQGLIKNKNA